MGTNEEWLDARRQQLTPTATERADVQEAINTVSRAIHSVFSIAEIHPCGSAAKGTMLKGRKEADLVLITKEAPTSQTLDAFRSVLSEAPNVQSAKRLHKAVETVFHNGVSVDVLPAAKTGLTDEGESIPRKHRHALDGLAHVRWFKTEGHFEGAHDLVRLAKNWRDANGLSLTSFGLEVLTVRTLKSAGARNLNECFSSVLAELARGNIAVVDPVRSGHRINVLDQREAERVMAAARASLDHLQRGEPHRAFAGSGYPSSVRGIAGTPLA